MNGFYTFDVPTQAGDPTGLWNAYIKVGGTTFHKGLRIETIKPNRLKIQSDATEDSSINRQKCHCSARFCVADGSHCLQIES